MIFTGTVRVTAMGLGAKAVSGVVAATAVAYMLANVICARRLTGERAGTMLVVSSAVCAVLSAAFLAWRGLLAIYVLTALVTATQAFFFAPFQVFMKQVDGGTRRPITRSIGLYVFSWSMGYAVGPYLSGRYWQVTGGLRVPVPWGRDVRLEGWEAAYVLCLLFSLLCLAIILVFLRHLRREIRPEEREATAGRRSGAAADRGPAAGWHALYARMPDRSWAAWTCAGAGILAVAVIRGLLPKHGDACGLGPAALGRVFFVLSCVQALTGLALGRTATWMYRPLPLLLFGLCGVGGMTLFAFADSAGLFLTAAAALGLSSGCFYTYFVFHPLVHPVHAPRNVAVNEAIVGLTGLLALAGGALADRSGFALPYAVTAVLVLLAAAAQCLVHRRDVSRLRELGGG